MNFSYFLGPYFRICLGDSHRDDTCFWQWQYTAKDFPDQLHVLLSAVQGLQPLLNTGWIERKSIFSLKNNVSCCLDRSQKHRIGDTRHSYNRVNWESFSSRAGAALQTFIILTHSRTLAWKIPWTEVPGGLQSMGSLRVGHDWAASLWLSTFMHWRRKWQPTPVFLPGESQGRGSLVGCRLWGCTESDTTEAT